MELIHEKTNLMKERDGALLGMKSANRSEKVLFHVFQKKTKKKKHNNKKFELKMKFIY
jgi:hypothetical protein